MQDKETGEILLLDWKTNKEISTTNFFQTAFPPIDHLQDTHISKYSLQLSLYQTIIVKENYYPNAKGFRQALIHFRPEAPRPNVIQLEYYDYEIKEMIRHAK